MRTRMGIRRFPTFVSSVLTSSPWPWDGYFLLLPLGVATYLVGIGMSTVPPTPEMALLGTSVMVGRWVLGLPLYYLVRRWSHSRPHPPSVFSVLVLNLFLAAAINIPTIVPLLMWDAYPLFNDTSGTFVTAMNTIMLWIELLIIGAAAGAQALRAAHSQRLAASLDILAAGEIKQAEQAAKALDGPREVLQSTVLPALREIETTALRIEKDQGNGERGDVTAFLELAELIDTVREHDVRKVSHNLTEAMREHSAQFDGSARGSAPVIHPPWPPVASTLDVRGSQLDEVIRSISLVAPVPALTVQGVLAPWMLASVGGQNLLQWGIGLVVSWLASAAAYIVVKVAQRNSDSWSDRQRRWGMLWGYSFPAIVSATVLVFVAPMSSNLAAVMMAVGLAIDIAMFNLVVQQVRIVRASTRLSEEQLRRDNDALVSNARDLQALVTQVTLDIVQILHSRVQGRLAAAVGILMGAVRSHEYSFDPGKAISTVARDIEELNVLVQTTLIPALNSRRYLSDVQLIDLPLGARMRRTVEEIAPALKVSVEVAAEVTSHDAIEENGILLIEAACQEGTANAVRHGGAQEVVIRLLRDHHDIVLLIDDDGAGMAVDSATGVGSLLLDRRAEQVGASWQRRPSTWLGGVTLEIRIPASVPPAVRQRKPANQELVTTPA